MADNRFLNIYHTTSVRAKWHDYNGGHISLPFVWQTRFHDRIIRNGTELSYRPNTLTAMWQIRILEVVGSE